MAASAHPLPSRPRLMLRPRSALLAPVEALLLRAGSRLDRLDPPVLEPVLEAAGAAPVLPLRLLREREELPRADR